MVSLQSALILIELCLIASEISIHKQRHDISTRIEIFASCKLDFI